MQGKCIVVICPLPFQKDKEHHLVRFWMQVHWFTIVMRTNTHT